MLPSLYDRLPPVAEELTGGAEIVFERCFSFPLDFSFFSALFASRCFFRAKKKYVRERES